MSSVARDRSEWMRSVIRSKLVQGAQVVPSRRACYASETTSAVIEPWP